MKTNNNALVNTKIRRLSKDMEPLYFLVKYLEKTISADAPFDLYYENKQRQHIALLEERIQKLEEEVYFFLEIKLKEVGYLTRVDLSRIDLIENLETKPLKKRVGEYEKDYKDMTPKRKAYIRKMAKRLANHIDTLEAQKEFLEQVSGVLPLDESFDKQQRKHIALIGEYIKIFTEVFDSVYPRILRAEDLLEKDLLSKEILEGIDAGLFNEQVYEDLKKDY